MKYSIVFLSAFLATGSLALPAPAPAPIAAPYSKAAPEAVAVRDESGLQAPNNEKAVRRAPQGAAGDNTDTEGDATDNSNDSAATGNEATDLSDTTDGGQRRKKNRRALAVRRQMRRTSRAVASRDANADAGYDSSASDDGAEPDTALEKKRHKTRALGLSKARRHARRANGATAVSAAGDTTDGDNTGSDSVTDGDGISTASEDGATSNDGVDTASDTDGDGIDTASDNDGVDTTDDEQ